MIISKALCLSHLMTVGDLATSLNNSILTDTIQKFELKFSVVLVVFITVTALLIVSLSGGHFYYIDLYFDIQIPCFLTCSDK